MSKKNRKDVKDFKDRSKGAGKFFYKSDSTALITTTSATAPVLDKHSVQTGSHYAILGLKEGATPQEIKKSYHKLLMRYHPDRFRHLSEDEQRKLNQQYAAKVQKIYQAYNALLGIRIHVDINRVCFLNQTTFLNLILVKNIHPDKLLILDHYAFDVDELKIYAEINIFNFYKNPHILESSQNQEFSDAAKLKLLLHPVLKKYAAQLNNYLTEAARYIKPQTVDAMIAMLQQLHRLHQKFLQHQNRQKWNDEIAGSAEAKANFLIHRELLTDFEQKQLDNFLIKIPFQQGGTQNVRLGDIIMSDAECIVTMQIFLWQFVISVRPESMNLIPKAVHEMASRHHFKIYPPVMIKPRLEGSGSYSLVPFLAPQEMAQPPHNQFENQLLWLASAILFEIMQSVTCLPALVQASSLWFFREHKFDKNYGDSNKFSPGL